MNARQGHTPAQFKRPLEGAAQKTEVMTSHPLASQCIASFILTARNRDLSFTHRVKSFSTFWSVQVQQNPNIPTI